MRKTLGPSTIWTVLSTLLLFGATGAVALEFEESDFLKSARRLTFEGRRAGEGYFSGDGTKLVFQSEREEGNPWYQIYLMDLLTGDTRRISSGAGKTTCPFINPKSNDVLFGSTHLDPNTLKLQKDELDFRASGKERRYSWDYDKAMDIFVADAETGELSRVTEEEGYDAEASYSPDGEWIVYSSLRDAYERELTDEEAKLREINPSYFGELYIMKADGSEKRRLTNTPGYDGGPFFSTDGKRVVWRRFSEDGLTADVYTINVDGTDEKRITDFGSLSWAPYEHPSEEYILFASNKLGFANFEIFMVDVNGTKEPVQITYTDGFDGLPVPSPDGKTLIWTSSRHGEGGQLYRAGWDHEMAMKALAASPPRKAASK
jgi:Tol biopolymer transport system component